jgi:hypothetical protein
MGKKRRRGMGNNGMGRMGRKGRDEKEEKGGSEK